MPEVANARLGNARPNSLVKSRENESRMYGVMPTGIFTKVATLQYTSRTTTIDSHSPEIQSYRDCFFGPEKGMYRKPLLQVEDFQYGSFDLEL